MRPRLLAVALSAASVALPAARADITLPAVVSDHMVLQRDAAAPVWGWADPGEEVTVAVAGQTHKAVPDAAGRWVVRLSGLPAGGPHVLTVTGKNTLTVRDVLVGEVWLGSGQSNMAMQVSRAKDADAEQKAADLPTVRLFTETSRPADAPKRAGAGQWVVCTPDAAAKFSATLFFFGRELHRELKVPVGLIASAVGGTPIEHWIDADAQRRTPALKPALDAPAKADAKKDRRADLGKLYDRKIAPLIPYAIRGAVWYQGEANSVPDAAPYYRHQLALLVTDWRARWGQGDFPFAWVQLPNFGGPGRDWPTVREGMRETLRLPNTGMAITIDVGEAKDIHPKNKQEVGRRLAAWALTAVYGRPGVASGPLPTGAAAGPDGVRVRFAHAEGLAARGGDPVGFELTGADGQWHPATARVDGPAVVVAAPAVPSPTAVRYAWANNPTVNLYNGAGLPASPFSLRVDPAR